MIPNHSLHTVPRRLALLLGCVLAAHLPALAGETITLQWQESGLVARTGGMRPRLLSLSATAPEGLKQAPTNLVSPRYSSFKLGPAKSPATYIVVIDEVDGKPARLIVDGNANGDLTDDPVGTWTTKPSHDPDGADATLHDASAVVTIPSAAGNRKGEVKFYTTRTDTKYGPGFKKTLACYADYGLVGEVKVGERVIPAALLDAGMTGAFRLDGKVMSTPILWLALTNGPREIGESFLANRPFEVDGHWWALTNLTEAGAFQIVAAAKPADADKRAATPAKVNLTGKIAPAFGGKLLDGRELKFPEDYKGKVVLLDFWATWCGPCVAEIPNVVAAYNKYHGRGFEVLGVSLDKADAGEKVAAFAKQKEMPWPQYYDGKYWAAEVPKLYGIHAIPRMMLVDGDTGKVLDDEGLRGEALAPAIEKALAAKKK